MSQTHQLLVTYVQGQTLATWSLDGVPHEDGDAFKVQPGDKVEFQFDGPGERLSTRMRSVAVVSIS